MSRFDERVPNGMSVFSAVVAAGSFAAAGTLSGKLHSDDGTSDEFLHAGA